MIDWINTHFWMILSIIGGVIVSIITSENHSPKIAIARVASGLFCAIALTDLVIWLVGVDPVSSREAIAGLLAMSGYGIARIFANIDKKTIMEIVTAVRGQKK